MSTVWGTESKEEQRIRRRQLAGTVRSVVLPITVQNLVGASVNTADVVMLGYLNQSALSASSLANQITMVLFMFFSGFPQASSSWRRSTGASSRPGPSAS